MWVGGCVMFLLLVGWLGVGGWGWVGGVLGGVVG